MRQAEDNHRTVGGEGEDSVLDESEGTEGNGVEDKHDGHEANGAQGKDDSVQDNRMGVKMIISLMQWSRQVMTRSIQSRKVESEERTQWSPNQR